MVNNLLLIFLDEETVSWCFVISCVLYWKTLIIFQMIVKSHENGHLNRLCFWPLRFFTRYSVSCKLLKIMVLPLPKDDFFKLKLCTFMQLKKCRKFCQHLLRQIPEPNYPPSAKTEILSQFGRHRGCQTTSVSFVVLFLLQNLMISKLFSI